MAWGNGAPRGWPNVGLAPGDLPEYMPQWLPAGVWEADPANSISSLVNRPYGAGPNNTYSIYPTISFPAVWQVSAQYWYFTAVPPLNWTSTKLKFQVHFIVEDTISLPGGYRFSLGVRRQQDVSATSGAKTIGSVDYNLADANVPRYRITAQSAEITLASAASGEGILCELTRGTNLTSDESDEAYVVGVVLYYV